MLFSKYSAAISVALTAVSATEAKKYGEHLPLGWMNHTQHSNQAIKLRSINDCNYLVDGLNYGDCMHMSKIGMSHQGLNHHWNDGSIWIGNDGPNTFTFTNEAVSPSPVPIILVFWDIENRFVGDPSKTAAVTYSLPNIGDQVTISVANGISGGFAALNNHVTFLSYGLVYNTWGEFTTGSSATVDVSREVNMGGNIMNINVSGGCRTNMNECVFVCRNGANQCGSERDTYDLKNCDYNSNPHAAPGFYDGQPSGGCQGWDYGGHIDVTLGRY